MALVTSVERSEKSRHSVHQHTQCVYSVVHSPTGDNYLQLDTVGSGDREFRGKVSQSLQFDRNAAGQIVQLLEQVFPGLAGEVLHGEIAEGEPGDDDEEPDPMEGGVTYRAHRVLERNASIVRRKKDSALAETGKLSCEVCGFDFAATYGELGAGFAECHHLFPLSELPTPQRTSLSDLAIVCANCHRMLHRRRGMTLSELANVVQNEHA